MAYELGKNVSVRYKVESVLGTLPGAAGGTLFRASPSAGLELKKASILPTEYRRDGMTVQALHGSKSVDGTYEADLRVGDVDALLEALCRGTWLPSFTITQAAMTSITTTTSTIVAAAGSWITEGVKVGDVVRLTNHSTVANNSKNLRVLGVTATTITVPTGDLVADAVADTSFTLTVCKRLIMGDPMVQRSFTFEEYFETIDKTEVFKGCRVVGATLRFNPDATVMVSFQLVGQDSETMEGASAPYFTAPVTETTSLGLVVVNAKVRLNNTDVTDFTSLEVTVNLNGSTVAVGGANISPDIFTNPAVVTGNIAFLRKDFAHKTLFQNETEFEIFVQCCEPDSEPKDFISFFFGSCKYMASQKSLGGDNGLVETYPINMGKDMAGGARAATMMLVSTSAA